MKKLGIVVGTVVGTVAVATGTVVALDNIPATKDKLNMSWENTDIIGNKVETSQKDKQELEASETKINELQTKVDEYTEKLSNYYVFITYVVNGEETTQIQDINSSADFEEPTLEGATFVGWSLSEGGEVIDSSTTFAENTTLYAIFEYDHSKAGLYETNGGPMLYSFDELEANGIVEWDGSVLTKADFSNVGGDLVFPKEMVGTSDAVKFTDNATITSISFEEGSECTVLPNFSWMSALKRIELPGSLTSMPKIAVCVELEEIVLPESVSFTTLPDSIFSSLPKVKTLIIPEGITTFVGMPISNLNALETVVLPSTLTSVDECIVYRSAKTNLNVIFKSTTVPSGCHPVDYNMGTISTYVPYEAFDTFDADTTYFGTLQGYYDVDSLVSALTRGQAEITYVVNGETTVQTQDLGLTIQNTNPTIPEGIEFSGWVLREGDYTSLISLDAPIYEDMTLYAYI